MRGLCVEQVEEIGLNAQDYPRASVTPGGTSRGHTRKGEFFSVIKTWPGGKGKLTCSQDKHMNYNL